MSMHTNIQEYNNSLSDSDTKICEALQKLIDRDLPEAESKIWHGHPVWFLDGNPIVGYSKEKPGIRLMFWSGADFDEPDLEQGTGKFKDASIFYTDESEIDSVSISRWLKKSKDIQWDYKNIVKRKGVLEKLQLPLSES